MINTILTIVITLLALSMFFLKREQKIMVMWFSMMCFAEFREISTLGVLLNIPMCFFLSEYNNIFSTLHSAKTIWLSKIIIVVSFAMVILYFSSPHYFQERGLLGAILIFVFELVRKYFFVLYALACVSGTSSLKSLLKVTTYGIIILTVFGAWELIAGHSVYMEYLFSGSELSVRNERILGDVIEGDRWHIRSLFKFSFDYGFMSIISLLLGAYGLNKRIISKFQSWVIILCAIFGIIMCGSRSVWIAAVASLLVYIIMANTVGRQIKTTISLTVVTLLLFYTVPQVRDVFGLAGSIFDEKSTYGSNLEQRQRSYDAVFLYSQRNIVFGNGKDYFVEDLGYGRESLADSDLAGLEGVMMNLLLERGLIGVFAYLIFYITLLVQIYKLRKVDKPTAGTAFSILVGYILYANFTGELGSVPPTLFLVGALLKILFQEERKKIINSYSQYAAA